MASNYERPDLAALSELEQMLRHLGEEVSGWRRRTQKAEAELQDARSRGGVLAGPELLQARQRVIDLEVENQGLRHRIEGARERLQALSSRLAFLETEGQGAA
jgi:predicted  nucleic acid-binding Zn-ribbon protein